MDSLHREVRRASRKRGELSLLIMDIDHFKEYNDRYGHSSGDLILKSIANTIRDLLEDPDIAGRYGGEEIAILLWGKGKQEAHLKADKIRQLIKDRTLTLREHKANVTVSIGVSTYPGDGLTEEELIRVADARLYRAKAEGRDKVCSA
jgi:diguanylate cyclase (GGDEF)-like protein